MPTCFLWSPNPNSFVNSSPGGQALTLSIPPLKFSQFLKSQCCQPDSPSTIAALTPLLRSSVLSFLPSHSHGQCPQPRTQNPWRAVDQLILSNWGSFLSVLLLSVVLFLALEMVTSTLRSVGLLQCKCFSQAAVYPLLAMGFLCVFILNNFLFHRNVTWPMEVFFWNAFHMYTQLSHLQAWISWSYPFFPVQILSLNIVRIKYLNPGNVSPGETHDLRAFKRSDGYWLNWLKAVIIQFWFTG